MQPSTKRSRVWCSALAAVMSAGLALTPVALADDEVSPKESCPDGQIAVIQTKECPETNQRSAVLVKRACCTKFTEKNPQTPTGGGKTRCKSFPKCPRNSPS